jgi:hypothetical protein
MSVEVKVEGTAIPICMVSGCGRPQVASWKRGICGKCYHQAKKLIESNTTTWEELASMGLCLDEDKPLLVEFLRQKRILEVLPKPDPTG